jgi:hypothetical protein
MMGLEEVFSSEPFVLLLFYQAMLMLLWSELRDKESSCDSKILCVVLTRGDSVVAASTISNNPNPSVADDDRQSKVARWGNNMVPLEYSRKKMHIERIKSRTAIN